MTLTGPQTGVGSLLREARKRRGLTQKQVAQAARCSAVYLSLIERGKRCHGLSHDLLLRLARAVCMNPTEVDSLLRAGGHLRPSKRFTDDERAELAAEFRAARVAAGLTATIDPDSPEGRSIRLVISEALESKTTRKGDRRKTR